MRPNKGEREPNPMTIESVTLPRALRDFVDTAKWTFAKTMPEWPHEYIVRDKVDENLFTMLVQHIRWQGYESKFYQKRFTYYDYHGMVYWTMGEPLGETTIINRCRKEDSYENRLNNGRLPENNSKA